MDVLSTDVFGMMDITSLLPPSRRLNDEASALYVRHNHIRLPSPPISPPSRFTSYKASALVSSSLCERQCYFGENLSCRIFLHPRPNPFSGPSLFISFLTPQADSISPKKSRLIPSEKQSPRPLLLLLNMLQNPLYSLVLIKSFSRQHLAGNVKDEIESPSM